MACENIMTASGTTNKEFRQVLKYNSPETALAKFIDVKTELYKKYKHDKAAGNITLENPGSLMKLVKEYGHSLGITDSRVHETDYEAVLAAVEEADTALAALLGTISIEADDVDVVVKAVPDEDSNFDVYVKQPRGAAFGFSVKNPGELKISVQNCFTTYSNEGFVLSFGRGGQYISLCTESKAGIKGAGTLYLYAMAGGMIYRAEVIDKLPGAEGILGLYRG